MKRLLFPACLALLAAGIFSQSAPAPLPGRAMADHSAGTPAEEAPWWSRALAALTGGAVMPASGTAQAKTAPAARPADVSPASGTGTRAAAASAFTGMNHAPRIPENAPSEHSLHQLITTDQNTGRALRYPASTGRRVAAAEVLDESGGDSGVEYHEAEDVPALDAPEWRKLRWIEAVMAGGVSEAEAAALARHMAHASSSSLAGAILAAASLAESGPALSAILRHGLAGARPLPVRMQALHLAGDHAPELVTAATRDTSEDLRLQALALLDPGQSGHEFRE